MLFSCEGKETEPRYLRALCKELGLIPDFAAQGGDPSYVVEQASQRHNDEHDAVWCVFDCNGHKHASAARQRAHDLGFSVAYSNPCVEIWYVLHFGYSTRQMTSTQARKACEAAIDGYAKSLDVYALLRGKQDEAITHAQRLRAKHDEEVNEGKARNPYTDFDLMVLALRKLAGR